LSIPCTSFSVEKEKQTDKRHKNGINKEKEKGVTKAEHRKKDKKKGGNK
jgi:hypothetical protein